MIMRRAWKTRVLRIIAWIEIVGAVVFLNAAAFPFSRYCSGRNLGLDCESLAIFGVNMVAPLGILLLVAGTWLLSKRSVKSQYVLVLGSLAIMMYWLSHML